VRPTPSETTTTSTVWPSSTANNGGKFIIGKESSDFYNWRTSRNDALWGVSGTAPSGGVNGNNNPCPTGFRVPTNAEFDTEINSWSTKNGDGAFNSSLRLTYCGVRFDNGTLDKVGIEGWYWVSTNANNGTYYFKKVVSSTFGTNSPTRAAIAMAVRCIKH
jgi:hypothetical protein